MTLTTVIDTRTNIKKCFVVKEEYELKENEKFIDIDWKIANEMLKPKWNGLAWEENATEEEIQARQEKNKIVKEVTEQEKLNAQLLQQNAEMQVQLEQQKQLNVQILLQLAGGKANV